MVRKGTGVESRSKPVVLTLAKLFAIALGIFAFIVLMPFLFLQINPRGYQLRHVKCKSEELLPVVERVFDINFPQQVADVKAAKTIAMEGFVKFIVRFVAEPNGVERFLGCFPQENKDPGVQRLPYETDRDRRRSGGWPLPRWFREPIRQGKILFYMAGGGKRVAIYVDMRDQKSFCVYIQGRFLEEYFKEPKQ
jgi:hypothetical protein